MTIRLKIPMTMPGMGYMCCAVSHPPLSFYRMHGHVTGVFMTPLIRALKRWFREIPANHVSKEHTKWLETCFSRLH